MRSKLAFLVLGLSLFGSCLAVPARAADCPQGQITFPAAGNYTTGQEISAWSSLNGTTAARSCMYDGNNNLVAQNYFPVGTVNGRVSYTIPDQAASAGNYKATLQSGAIANPCPATLATDACFESQAVTPSAAAAAAAGGTTGGETGGETGGATGATGGIPSYPNPLAGTIDDIFGAGQTTVSALLGLIGIIALIVLVLAGLTYLTSAGSEDKIKTAKNMITYTVIGIGVALLAYSLLNTLLDMLDGRV